MTLGDGKKKMSKSDPKVSNTIFLSDHPEDVAAKIKKAKTDSHRTLQADNPQRPECHNLLSMLGTLRGEAVSTNGLNYAQLKAQLISGIQDELRGISQAKAERHDISLGMFVEPTFKAVEEKINKGKNNENN